MKSKDVLIALSTAIALGVFGTSLSQAASDNEPGEGRSFHIGPTGQVLGTPPAYSYEPTGTNAYGFAPPARAHHPAPRHNYDR
jgi:hypothetical protein